MVVNEDVYRLFQDGHSPVLVKFPDFLTTFPGISNRSININHQRYTNRPACTPEWILWHYWQSIYDLVHVNFSQQYSGYVYFVTIATVVAHHRLTTNYPDFSDIS